MNTTNSSTADAEAVLKFLRDEVLSPGEGEGLGGDADLLASGLLDSLAVMRLVGFLEKEFSISVPPEDVTIENFQTPCVIATYARSRQQS